MTNEKNNVYTTRDLYLASTLITLKFFMQGVDYQIERDRPVGYFNFSNNDKLQDAINKYRQGMLSVEPKAFITTMRELKSEVATTYKSPTSQFNK